jgi:integrase
MLQWTDPDTNRVKSKSAKTSNEAEAEAKRVDLEADLNAGRYQEASKMTWERFRELFEDEYVAGLRQRTQGVYSNVLDQFESLCNPKTVRAITARTVSSFAAGLRKLPGRGNKNRLASTIKVQLQFLHTALEWAAKQGLISECPDFPIIKVPEKSPQPVPVESFERIYTKAEGNPQLQAYMLSSWLAGLRLAEAYELEWNENPKMPWVDLARNRIVLPAEFAKAVKDQWVPLAPQLRKALEELPRHGKKVFRFIGRHGRLLTVNRVGQMVTEAARKAGVRLTMKSLRRGFGCRYAGKVPAQVLQRLMRHSSISTTMKYYANIDDAVMQAVLGVEHNSFDNSSPPNREDSIRSSDASGEYDYGSDKS